MKESVDCLMDLWDTMKLTNICIVGVPEEKSGGKGQKDFPKK